MKILSWNINGIRASKRNLKELLDSLDADVICLQETKVTRDMLDEATAIVDGYTSYYSYSRKRSGYSGVATYCKEHVTPEKAEEGLSGNLSSGTSGILGHYGNHSPFTEDEIIALDAEGRAVLTRHKIRYVDGSEADLCIINVYCPRFDPDREDRHLYKLRFYALLQTRAEALLESGCHVIILGDINTTHKAIDRSENDEEAAGRTPSRLWFNQMLWDKDKDETLLGKLDENEFAAITPHTKGGMFVDTYRYFYPDKEGAYSNWCTLTNARATNYGRRLDYIFADVKLTEASVISADILQDVQGSDHCPVTVELSCKCIPGKTCPALCTKFMPEFSGKQQKLSSFFTKMKKDDTVEGSSDNASGVVDNKQAVENISVNKGEKRSLDLSDIVSRDQKRKKTNGKVTQGKLTSGKSGQSTLKGFFLKSKVEVDTKVDSKMIIKSNRSEQQSNCEIPNGIDSVTSTYFNNKHKEETCEKGTLLKDNSKETAKAWKSLLGGLGPAPLCKGHNEPCVLRTVKKEGPNKGKQFYVCNRGEGLKNNPEARCDFFKWIEKKR